MSKCQIWRDLTLKERIDKALRWVYTYRVLSDPINCAKYQEYVPQLKVKKTYPNQVTDELEAIIKRVGWRAFRHALITYAQRRAEDDTFIGLTTKWDKVLVRFEQLFKEP